MSRSVMIKEPALQDTLENHNAGSVWSIRGKGKTDHGRPGRRLGNQAKRQEMTSGHGKVGIDRIQIGPQSSCWEKTLYFKSHQPGEKQFC